MGLKKRKPFTLKSENKKGAKNQRLKCICGSKAAIIELFERGY
jgi:hypothetical protein